LLHFPILHSIVEHMAASLWMKSSGNPTKPWKANCPVAAADSCRD
jgi:hypothetical protein